MKELRREGRQGDKGTNFSLLLITYYLLLHHPITSSSHQPPTINHHPITPSFPYRMVTNSSADEG
ncbi:MAG: hypothetical protein QNJ63_19790 [Calothrix sp. MO_192.B10]|nr:hypothetical protein [Calothrix sp. MO_192.B10]